MNKQLLAPLAASLLCMTANAQAPAFPGAEGHGRYVTGGRGGEIIHATPTKGVNIRQTTLANGKVVTDKVIK